MTDISDHLAAIRGSLEETMDEKTRKKIERRAQELLDEDPKERPRG